MDGVTVRGTARRYAPNGWNGMEIDRFGEGFLCRCADFCVMDRMTRCGFGEKTGGIGVAEVSRTVGRDTAEVAFQDGI